MKYIIYTSLPDPTAAEDIIDVVAIVETEERAVELANKLNINPRFEHVEELLIKYAPQPQHQNRRT